MQNKIDNLRKQIQELESKLEADLKIIDLIDYERTNKLIYKIYDLKVKLSKLQCYDCPY